jgi:hypothetical protein
MIVVSPDQFAGAVQCLAEPGAMRRYVATLFDVTGDYEGTVPALPSSPPTDCNLSVGFGFVEPGRKYRAEIDGYDREDLTPVTPGNRLMRRAGGDANELVAPRWRASCSNPVAELADAAAADGGNGLEFLNGPAEATLNSAVHVVGCTAFVELEPGVADTAIRIDATSLLAGLQCGAAAGQVLEYQATPRDGAGGAQRVACGNDIVFAALAADTPYFFDVIAFTTPPETDAAASDAGDAGDGGPATPASAAWTTSCFQRSAAGVERLAVCDPLQPLP